MTTTRRRLAAILLVAALGAACGPPAPLLESQIAGDADAEFRKGDFNLAAKHYDELLEQYPFSDQAETARLRVAQSYYLSKNYEKAIAAFEDFERLHPTSPMLPYVEYTIGMAYLEQRRTRDRDKSSAESALRQFESVADRYRDTLYGRLAEYRLDQCRQTLASHELYVGDYYRGKKDFNAARRRYQYLLDNYPRTDAAYEATQRLDALKDLAVEGGGAAVPHEAATRSSGSAQVEPSPAAHAGDPAGLLPTRDE